MRETSVLDPLIPQESRRNSSVVNDGSLDYRSRPALRSITGGWRASAFIIGYEIVERIAYYGIYSNLVLYLINGLHIGSASAAIAVNNWGGTAAVLPIFGALIADTYLGRYWTIVSMSGFYAIGCILLTISASFSALKPAPCVNDACPTATSYQLALFFIALYLVAIGAGGVKPCLEAFGADQFDEENPDENKMRSSFFNWWYFGVCTGALLAFSVIVYIEDNASWALGIGIIAALVIVTCVLFLMGTPFYRNKLPSGSPLLGIAQVFVASTQKWNVNVPENEDLLYDVYDNESKRIGRRKLSHTDGLRFLDKAATIENLDKLLCQAGYIMEDGNFASLNRSITNINFEDMELSRDPWRLCTVTQVEEAKLILRILPIWLTTVVDGLVLSQALTFFIEEASTLDRSIGSLFTIPSASLLSFSCVAILIVLPVYDRIFVPIARCFTGHERGLTLLQRLGVGLVLSVVCCVIAALVEAKRLEVAAQYGLLDHPSVTIPMSVLWLVPQNAVLGVSNVFALVGQQEFFYDQFPDTMRSIGIALYVLSSGFGSYLSSALIFAVKFVTSRWNGSWIVDNINRSHLDYFYWFLTVLGTMNLFIFLALSRSYTYKTVCASHRSQK